MAIDADDDWRPAQRMAPARTHRFRVPIHALDTAITPASDMFVLAHFGVPRIDPRDWRLHLTGLVRTPRVLAFGELQRRFARRELTSFIKCAGFPDDPTINTHNASNAVWSGFDLAEVLDDAGLDPAVTHVWSYGSDHGRYADWSADAYIKDLPISRVAAGGVLLADRVDGEPLSAEHGYPLRLFVPGFYGTNSVKWLCRIEAADRRAPGILTTRLYNDPIADAAPGEPATAPVWAAPPDSIIVEPRDRATLPTGATTIRGWAWANDGIAAVDVSVDDGRTWRPAAVASRIDHSWQRFELTAPLDRASTACLLARATDTAGRTQPSHAARNAMHRITVQVVD